MVRPARLWLLLLMTLALVPFIAAACGGDDDDAPSDDGSVVLKVVTTVSPLRSIIENVGGDRVSVIWLIPEGINSHTFEPNPSAVRDIAEADIIIINGLNLELPTLELSKANKRDDAEILLLGEGTVSPDEYVFDFSFPADGGNPNPHLWTDPNLALAYAELVRDAFSELDPEGADYYALNYDAFSERVLALDALIVEAVSTIPPDQRKLLTYHDSFPYFGPRYGFEIIGAIQPSNFSEPSPREVADLIEQIRESGVPAIFGSEVFPSRVLETIANEVGAVQVSNLRDDNLPGEPGDPENTYIAMMVEDVRIMVSALGGDASILDGFPILDSWIPFDDATP
jgi:ABC-type Zn uptake system ZnuABC Zn-binding protein ZnuA